ncbi:MAG TPA: nucleotidyl transferase AbiEii/AbiGii toxin family protein [Patescibacteria group bacterium]|nr:nucleotidyl transferase AbiEii/AbiGii toxin family protein [Patescibacteria group bacterium]
MISQSQLSALAHQLKTNEATVYREYLQVLFLSKFYARVTGDIYFKGGTAIHLIFAAPRFSEDLDFSVTCSESKFKFLVEPVFSEIMREAPVTFKQRQTIAGERYLLTSRTPVVRSAAFINLDFSFREAVFDPDKSIIDTVYPVLFTSFIHHLSAKEILAEKIRAILIRKKGRDIYDLWYLLSQGVVVDKQLVLEKLKYYKKDKADLEGLRGRVAEFSERDFVQDLRPFVALGERDKLGRLFAYTRQYLAEKLPRQL